MINPDQENRTSVLIVEDDPQTRKALSTLLRSLGYHVYTASSVAEGLDRLDGQDCVVLDLNLPDGLGTYILQRIRDENRPTRVAVVTGCTDPTIVGDAQRGGADLILRKPLAVSSLIDWLDHPPVGRHPLADAG